MTPEELRAKWDSPGNEHGQIMSTEEYLFRLRAMDEDNPMTPEAFVLKIADPEEVLYLLSASIDTVARLCAQTGSQIDLDPLRDLAAQIEAQVSP